MKKLKSSENFKDVAVDNAFGYRLINFVAVMTAISEYVVCKTCGTNIKFSESSKRGLGFKIIVSCEQCVRKEISIYPFINNGYEINKRICLAMRLLGIGLQGIKKFCAFMDMPNPIFHSFYDSLVNTISLATEAVRTVSVKNAARQEKVKSIEEGQTE